MKRAIVTGGTGFVGANLVRRLLRDGHEVHLLVRPGYAVWRIEALRSDVSLHEVELHDPTSVAKAVSRIRPDWIFHLAAHGAYSWQEDMHRMVQTNIVGTVNLVEACLSAGFAAFVNAGSSSEYGFKDHAPSETEPLDPNSHYAVTKASATLYCRYASRSRNVRITTLRLYSVYGPYEEPRRLVPTLIVHGLEGELPPLVNPDTARDFIYVDDVIEAFILAAGRMGGEPGAVYNVGTGVQTCMREAVETARRVLGIKAEAHWGSMPGRIWDTSVWVADNRRIREELGWKPAHTFEEGFRKTADWLRADPAMAAFYRRSRR